MSEDRARYVYQSRLAARILSESCESCLQRQFEYVCVWGTFVCTECVKAIR